MKYPMKYPSPSNIFILSTMVFWSEISYIPMKIQLNPLHRSRNRSSGHLAR